MTTQDPRLPEILATLRWRARPERFVLAGINLRERAVVQRLLGVASGSFVQMLIEPQIISLLLPESDWREIRPAFPQARVQRGLRVIHLELDLPEDLVGFLAAIAGRLAEAGVPLLAACGFSRDHLIVRDQDLATAEQTLTAWVAPYRQ